MSCHIWEIITPIEALASSAAMQFPMAALCFGIQIGVVLKDLTFASEILFDRE